MFSALLYLRLTSLKNWVLSRSRRLRQPKYLVGALAGAAYFWFFLLRHVFAAPTLPNLPSRVHPPGLDAFPITFILVQVILLMAVGRLILAWIAPDKPGLIFTEAEIAFLFPAPITRRTLIHFKLLSSQFTILLSSVLLTLMSSRWSMLGGNLFTHAIGWWIIFSTINLHNIGAAFTVSRLTDQGVSPTRRRAIVLSAITALLLIGAYTVWRSVPSPAGSELANASGFFRYLQRVANTGVLYWLLYPVRLTAGPFLAATVHEFFLALAPSLLLLALHYVWVARAETSFEEASIALAEKRSRIVAAVRSGNARLAFAPPKARPGPFPLAAGGGRPEIAFLWKNLLSTRAYLNHRTFIVLVVITVGVHGWFSQGTAGERAALGFAGMFALVIAGWTLVIGPQLARQDLRSDLANVDLLKTYPLPGWQIVLGELLTPVAILTCILWLMLLTAALDLGGLGGTGFVVQPAFRVTAVCCLAVITPLLCLLQLMVPNGAMLLFPSWAQAANTRERGIDVMGQRLIFVAGQLLVIVCALFPAALLGLLLWFGAHLVLAEAGSSIVAAVGVLGVLLSEVWLGLWWLGRSFEKFDLSNEAIK